MIFLKYPIYAYLYHQKKVQCLDIFVIFGLIKCCSSCSRTRTLELWLQFHKKPNMLGVDFTAQIPSGYVEWGIWVLVYVMLKESVLRIMFLKILPDCPVFIFKACFLNYFNTGIRNPISCHMQNKVNILSVFGSFCTSQWHLYCWHGKREY